MSKKMTGKELVAFARSKIGTPYVYGAKGEVLTKEKYDWLKKQYGSLVWDSDKKKIGKVCVDCSGLLSWACGVVLGSSQWNSHADVKKPIQSISEAPMGALVWCKGHIGVYSGLKNGVPCYIAADGSAYGVREVPLSQNKFTHWLLVHDFFEYEEDEMVERDMIVVNDTEYSVDMIRKDGTTFIKTRDIADILGMKVSSMGRIPVLESGKK